MHVCRGPDVLAPAVFGGGETPKDVRGVMSIEERDDAKGVGVRVRKSAVRELLADQRPDRVRSARAVPLAYPGIELAEQLRLERDPDADDPRRHDSSLELEGVCSPTREGGGDRGGKPISS
jgi:hypothetical protein